MKTPFVTDLNSEQSITTFFLVREKEIRSTREGKPYLRLELGDRSGTIEARMWDQFDAAVKNINRDDFVKVNARVEIYRNKPSSLFSSCGSRNPKRSTSPTSCPTQKKTSVSF